MRLISSQLDKLSIYDMRFKGYQLRINKNLNLMAEGIQTASGQTSPSQSSIRNTILIKLEIENKRRKKLERIAFVCCLLLVAGFGVSVWATDGAVMSGVVDILQRLEPAAKRQRNASLNCQNPENRYTPYCEDRAADQAKSWRNISRSWGGKTAFSLHGK